MIDTLEYNSTRKPLLIPEYGRIIQKMADYCVSISDKEERTRMAQIVVEIMANIHNLNIENNEETLHRLWDHLFIISNFKLNVDAPFPKPEEKSLAFTPFKPAYNMEKHGSDYRNYGKNIKSLIHEVCNIKNEVDRTKAVLLLANHMKKTYLTWNRDVVPDEIILEHLRIFSNGLLTLPPDTVLMDADSIHTMNNKIDTSVKQQQGRGLNNGKKTKKKRKKIISNNKAKK